MYALIRPFIRLSLLDAGPQDLPASRILLGLCLAGYIGISLLVAVPGYGVGSALLQTGLDAALLAAYTRFILKARRHSERFLQTLIALLGTGILFSVLALPFAYSIAGQPPTSDLTVFAYLVVLGWIVVVYGHIFRHALTTTLFVGIAIALGYVLLTAMIMQALFAPPVAVP